MVGVAARMLEAPDLGASPAARWTSTGRVAAAGTLVLGAAFQLAAFITEPKHDETIDRLRWIANSPDRADLAKTFDLVAMPFLLGTALVYVAARRTSPRDELGIGEQLVQ